MSVVLSRRVQKRAEALKVYYDPKQYRPEKVLNLREDGSLSLDSFRTILYIALGLATLRSYKEIIKMCSEDMKITPTHQVIRKVEDWMRKLELFPEKKFYGKATRWYEVYEQYKLARSNYMANLQDEPLAHPRGRFSKLVELLQKAEEGTVKRVHMVKNTIVDDNGLPLKDENGKPLMHVQTIAEKEPDLPTAVQIIKLMGQESGTLVQVHEHKHSFPELVREFRKKQHQNIDDAQYVMSLPGALSDEERD
jgi:hypothetical protein